ncbi:hypothetical protein ABH19_01640 [Leptospirillum sp. Group II 'CF-1']|nr:hypothetical protein ABH19_01640 [Leptospirillum sp. Group II 'CF-1']
MVFFLPGEQKHRAYAGSVFMYCFPHSRDGSQNLIGGVGPGNKFSCNFGLSLSKLKPIRQSFQFPSKR